MRILKRPTIPRATERASWSNPANGYTEDLQHGQWIEQTLRIDNPLFGLPA
jgi:hypothetical protein